MSAKLLTDRFVAAAKPAHDAAGKAVRAEYSDVASPGLRLIVQPTGSRSWALRYRRPDGRTAKKTFDGSLSLTAARAAASTARLELERGADPAPQRPPIATYSGGADEVIEVAAARFLELHARRIRPSTLRQYADLLDRHIVPAWRGRAIDSIRRRDAIDLVERIGLTHGVLANRTIAVGSKFFAWMIARDMVENNPFTGVERQVVEKPRQNVIPDDDLRALWIAAPRMGAFGAPLQLLVLTACRLQEVSRMAWTELNLEHRVWVIPGSRTKNHRNHAVPLSTQAVEILDALPRRGEFVFSVDGSRPVSGWGTAKPKISAAAGIDANTWRLHDLRRTAASGMQKLGIQVPTIEKALNHVGGTFAGIVSVYQQHDYADDVAIALQRWADHVTGKAAKVVKLRRS